MKTKKWTIIFLLFAGIILFAAQTAMAGCEIPFLSDYVEKKAPGTRYKGTLALYFDEGLTNGEVEVMPSLYIFARIENNKVPYAFAGKIENVTHQDLINDPTVISEFFTDNVIPDLYNCDPGYDETLPNNGCNDELYPDNCALCPLVDFKSYSNDVNWQNPGCLNNEVYAQNPYEFYILDFAIAADDK